MKRIKKKKNKNKFVKKVEVKKSGEDWNKRNVTNKRQQILATRLTREASRSSRESVGCVATNWSLGD